MLDEMAGDGWVTSTFGEKGWLAPFAMVPKLAGFVRIQQRFHFASRGGLCRISTATR